MNINADFCEKMYTKNPDPWSFTSAPYDLHRYERICTILSHKKHHLIFEAGCSIGVLTKQLASLAHRVEAIDISPKATSLAKARCENLENIKITCSSLKDYSFNKPIDVIVLSEIGYYFDAQEWKNILREIIESCPPPFYLLVSHWLGNSADHFLSGDEVHSIVYSMNELHPVHSERHVNFRLDYWIRK